MTIKKIGNLIFYLLKKNVIIFIIILFCATSASASILSDAANSLSAGESIKITTKNLTTVAINNGDSVTMWGNTGVWCPIRKRGIWIGKRHSYNPYKRIEYDEATNTWTSESLPSALTSDRLGHGYDHDAIDPSTGNIYFKSYDDNVVHKWTRSSDTWSTIDAIPGSTQCCETLEWWAGRGLVYSDDYGVRLWNESSWSTIILNGSISSIGYHSFGEYQPNADMYVFGGGNADNSRLYRLENDDTLTLLGNASIGLGNSSTSQGILVNDPASNYYIAWDEINTWYQFDPINDQWSSLSECSGDGSTACTGTPNFSDLSYAIAIAISDYNVIMFLSHRSNDVWLYKHAQSGGGTQSDTADPAISTFDITSMSSSYLIPINSFVATDNIGVAGYYISESPTQPQAIDSGWTSSPPSNFQVSSGGTLTLYAWAKDAAGNISSRSSDTVQISIPDPSDGNTGDVQSFRITSTTTGADIPFTTGLAFKKGDVTDTPTLDLSDYQVVVKKRWNDNSVKHAIVSGHANLNASTPLTIQVNGSGVLPYGTNLTASDIQSANPSASIKCGSIGTVNLSSLLGSPVRTWISGPEMVEAHYQSDVGSDATLVAKFHVRLYKNDDIWIRAIVENGALDVDTANKSYVPTVNIGGSVLYNNGGSSLSHYAHTRWAVEGWIGISDPKISIDLDTSYLKASGLVPNYWKSNPSSGALNGLNQTYTPMQQGGWTQSMGGTGFQKQIGLLPMWDALYVNSDGDSRAFNAVISNAKSLNSYPVVWSDSSTDAPIVLSDWGTWTVSGANGGGATSRSAGPLTWDIAHHGSGGYLAYLITGDYYHLETMGYQAALCYLFTSSNRGSGTSRVLLPVQTRGVAWSNRTVGQLAAIGPSDSIVDDFRALFTTSVNYWNVKRQQAGQNLIGYLWSYEIGAYGEGKVSPWQQHFWVQTYGYLSDLEPVSNMTNMNAVRDYLYKSVVGIAGPNGTDHHCYTKASSYTLKISDTNGDSTTWYDSWGMVYEKSYGSSNTSCGNTLEGGSGGDPANAATGYWGNFLPAIAYAVDDDAIGASAAWSRLTEASNWSTLENSGFDDIPIWGIVPRSDPGSPPPASPNPPTNLRIVTE